MSKVKVKRLTLNLDQVERVLLTAQRMSNVFYNIKQDKSVPEIWRKIADGLVAEWDALKKQ